MAVNRRGRPWDPSLDIAWEITDERPDRTLQYHIELLRVLPRFGTRYRPRRWEPPGEDESDDESVGWHMTIASGRTGRRWVIWVIPCPAVEGVTRNDIFEIISVWLTPAVMRYLNAVAQFAESDAAYVVNIDTV